MTEVSINVSRSYSAYIGYNLLVDFQKFIPEKFETSKIAIITNQESAKLYLNPIISSLETAGFKLYIYVDDINESNKSTDKSIEIISFLFKNKLTRQDLLLALGDGSIIDIVGFCASIYLRGIHYISIPTTLLPMIDQAIGGKTGVNTTVGKNLVGTIHQPSAVVCDVWTLTDKLILNFEQAAGEIMKCGAIHDARLFDDFANINSIEHMTSIISRCIRIKSHYIAEDEYENGERKILTFGHLIGFAIEHYSNYKVHHGIAVGIGCAMITKASETLGYTKSGCYETIVRTLKKLKLPYHYDIPLKSLLNYIYQCPYINRNTLDIVIIRDIGSPFIFKLKHNMIANFFGVLY